MLTDPITEKIDSLMGPVEALRHEWRRSQAIKRKNLKFGEVFPQLKAGKGIRWFGGQPFHILDLARDGVHLEMDDIFASDWEIVGDGEA